ncbi:DUF2972 domain-containing protein, partial [Campylobacter helveticus]
VASWKYYGEFERMCERGSQTTPLI